MLLNFLGAAHEVTGSCYLLEIGGKKLLVDCGMRQGPDEYKSQAFSFDAQSIDLSLIHILVGYGLDYASKYRNYDCVGVLKREIYE